MANALTLGVFTHGKLADVGLGFAREVDLMGDAHEAKQRPVLGLGDEHGGLWTHPVEVLRDEALLLAVQAVRSALADTTRPQDYLALGNSVAFGTNPLLDRSNADNFIGYPTPVAAALTETLTNASCPGETSSHFISLAGTDNGCGAYRLTFPLHVAYSTTELEFADGFLQSHLQTLAVSIDIGANDLFVLINGCGGQANVSCILSGLPGMLAVLSANLDTMASWEDRSGNSE